METICVKEQKILNKTNLAYFDDNNDVEQFARNSIPVLDTETRTALIKCVSPETVFFVGKGMVYRFFFLIILLFNNVNAMMIRN